MTDRGGPTDFPSRRNRGGSRCPSRLNPVDLAPAQALARAVAAARLRLAGGRGLHAPPFTPRTAARPGVTSPLGPLPQEEGQLAHLGVEPLGLAGPADQF